MDPTVHGYSLTARKPAAGVGATCGFAGTTPSRVASMRAYASGASDLSAVSKAPFFEVVMRPVFRHPRRQRELYLTDFWISLSRLACCGKTLAASHFATPARGSTTPQMGGDERN